MGGLQERITSTERGSVTSIQAVYVPADDLTDPAPASVFAHLNATTTLSRAISEKGIFPAVHPLDSTSTILKPDVVGEEHYRTATDVQEVLQRYKELQDIIAILGIDELSDEDNRRSRGPARSSASSRSRSSSPSSSPAAAASRAGRRDRSRLPRILDGEHDDLPEGAFYMQGGIDQVTENAGPTPSTSSTPRPAWRTSSAAGCCAGSPCPTAAAARHVASDPSTRWPTASWVRSSSRTSPSSSSLFQTMEAWVRGRANEVSRVLGDRRTTFAVIHHVGSVAAARGRVLHGGAAALS